VADRQLPAYDLTGVDFVTIDPPSSTDLDQALFIERLGEGTTSSTPSPMCRRSCSPGRPLDAETRRRGQTFYAPDGRIPLHPEVISENAGSLLAGQDCSAFVWEFELDAAAEVTSVPVRRARCAAGPSSATRAPGGTGCRHGPAHAAAPA
jgi:exoribonuclease R